MNVVDGSEQPGDVKSADEKLPGLVLVTGGTGTVGGALIDELLARGYEVRALVRSLKRGSELLPSEVELVVGDVTDPESLQLALAGVGTVVHAAGLPEQWHENENIFDEVNLQGTINVADAALEEDVECFIHVSTIDVFVWSPGDLFDETIDPDPKHTRYEQSKQAADRAVVERMEKGLPARFVCPAGVFGKAAVVTPGVNKLFLDLMQGEIPMLLPGGFPLVYAPDVAEGIIRIGLGPVGTRAILSGPYMTLQEIAELVAKTSGTSKVPRVLPTWFAHLVSWAGTKIAGRTGKPPLIAAGTLMFLEAHVVPDSSHATNDLGWEQTPLEHAVGVTVDWLKPQV